MNEHILKKYTNIWSNIINRNVIILNLLIERQESSVKDDASNNISNLSVTLKLILGLCSSLLLAFHYMHTQNNSSI